MTDETPSPCTESLAPPSWYLGLRQLAGIVEILIGLGLVLAGLRTVQVILDEGTGTPKGMSYAWTLHQALAPRYEAWARQWLSAKRAETLELHDISGTEWPLFGSVFYLEAVESLQSRWQEANEPEPMSYAAGSVEAATELVLHPSSAAWVRRHWGDDYLARENAFYRMLVLRAIIAHHHLTGSTQHLELLNDQVTSLMLELDASPAGLLDDYPDQCFPADIAATIAAIRRAGVILHEDYEAFISKAQRGFIGRNAGRLGLPPYFADRDTGHPDDDSRGCSNSYLLLSAPIAWPEKAKKWYALYEQHFWQRDWLTAGWREFEHGRSGLYFDVDSGPVLAGIGFAASAFGTGAARTNGHFDHAWPLEVESIALSFPLPGGHLLVPAMLSNVSDAPLLGEASVLYNLTRVPAHGVAIESPVKTLPGIVWIVLFITLILGPWEMWQGFRHLTTKPSPSPSSVD